MKFIDKQKVCLLEIRLPKEITKSPAAMEIFFSYFYQSGAGNYSETFLDGLTRPWFSCELVSIGGEVKFFIWCSRGAKFKSMIETQLYAQYPNVEIYEIAEENDYTKAIHFDTEKYVFFGVQYTLTKPDPYPIKTYIDYGLDRDQKDEYKVDPMTAVLEFLGSLRRGENIWIQILIQRFEKEGWFHGSYKSGRDLKKDIKTEIEKIREETVPKGKGDDKTFKFPDPTKGQVEIISALERSASKPAFECMMRSIYIAEKNSFNPANISGMIGNVKQYNSNTLNGFRPDFLTDLSDGMKDIIRILPFIKKSQYEKVVESKMDLLHAYKLRSFFQYPFKNFGGKPFILTTEELATIFHFPSIIVSQTPTLNRVPSKKSEAPANLPV